MNIRPATALDAEPGSLVLRRSITELCHADHGGDPVKIGQWTANKTPAEWRAWLARADIGLFVATENGAILGVALIDAGGAIRLNYVSPDARLRGVSKALLGHLENRARARGVNRCTLESSVTAERFYTAHGYRVVDEVARLERRLFKNL